MDGEIGGSGSFRTEPSSHPTFSFYVRRPSDVLPSTRQKTPPPELTFFEELGSPPHAGGTPSTPFLRGNSSSSLFGDSFRSDGSFEPRTPRNEKEIPPAIRITENCYLSVLCPRLFQLRHWGKFFAGKGLQILERIFKKAEDDPRLIVHVFRESGKNPRSTLVYQKGERTSEKVPFDELCSVSIGIYCPDSSDACILGPFWFNRSTDSETRAERLLNRHGNNKATVLSYVLQMYHETLIRTRGSPVTDFYVYSQQRTQTNDRLVRRYLELMDGLPRMRRNPFTATDPAQHLQHFMYELVLVAIGPTKYDPQDLPRFELEVAEPIIVQLSVDITTPKMFETTFKIDGQRLICHRSQYDVLFLRWQKLKMRGPKNEAFADWILKEMPGYLATALVPIMAAYQESGYAESLIDFMKTQKDVSVV